MFVDDVPDSAETNTRIVSFVVDVPAGAPFGFNNYRFSARYDATGTDGFPTDTELGAGALFFVGGGNPSILLGLSSMSR